jgi:SAM-dependent methyltransferase
VLRHRTQILYLADISLVVAQLDLGPGAVVLESGTGSASLTHALARAVAPHGRVRSFEFHELRAKEAAAELARNGLPPTLASVTLRNIEELGFPVDELEGAADGVFLDLPGPWKVVPSAAQCLKPNGRFCSFSPCIEQVGRLGGGTGCGAWARARAQAEFRQRGPAGQAVRSRLVRQCCTPLIPLQLPRRQSGAWSGVGRGAWGVAWGVGRGVLHSPPPGLSARHLFPHPLTCAPPAAQTGPAHVRAAGRLRHD